MRDAHDDWIAKARAVTVRDELDRRGAWQARMHGDNGVPCPAPGCGGRDRFSVNQRKNVFFCRATGAAGDAIALVQHLEGCNFLTAVEILAGPPPRGEGETEAQRRAREEVAAERAQQALFDQARSETIENEYRERERKAARDIWERGAPIAGTLAEAYLRHRGVSAPAGAHLRFRADAKLWSDSKPRKLLHTGPALIAGVVGPDYHFYGVEQIWIDLDQVKGKALVADSETGELAPAKKTRGRKKGGFCQLVRRHEPRRLFIGEGVETVLSVWAALNEAESPMLDGAEFRATLTIINLAGLAEKDGPASDRKKADRNGRLLPVRVPSDVPRALEKDVPLEPIPESVTDLYLLADGDSDPFFTQQAMTRAARRYRRVYPNLRIFIVWPRDGLDFNDQWLKEQGRAA